MAWMCHTPIPSMMKLIVIYIAIYVVQSRQYVDIPLEQVQPMHHSRGVTSSAETDTGAILSNYPLSNHWAHSRNHNARNTQHGSIRRTVFTKLLKLINTHLSNTNSLDRLLWTVKSSNQVTYSAKSRTEIESLIDQSQWNSEESRNTRPLPMKELKLPNEHGLSNEHYLENDHLPNNHHRPDALPKRTIMNGIRHPVCPFIHESVRLLHARDSTHTLVEVYQPPNIDTNSNAGQWFDTIRCNTTDYREREDCPEDSPKCCRAVDRVRFTSECTTRMNLQNAKIKRPNESVWRFGWIQVNSSCSCEIKARSTFIIVT